MFHLARLSLANRAVVALVTIATAVFGVLSMTSLKQELIPSLQLPNGIVSAQYQGSSPEIVEEQVTDVIEDAVASIDGIAAVRSTASTGVSLTTVEFTYGTDMEAASQRLQTAVAGIQPALPDGVSPQVTTGSVDDVPVVQMAVAGDKSPNALADTVEDVVVPALEDVDGVRAVAVTGERETEVRILPDQEKLDAAGLTAEDLTTVLQDNGVVLPAGEITEGGRAWSVQLGKPVDMVAQIAQLPVIPGGPGGPGAAGGAAAAGDTAGGATGTDADAMAGVLPADPSAPAVPDSPPLLGQVASVQLEPVEATSYSRLDGEPSLGLAITKTPEANTVEVSRAIERALAEADVADTLTERGVDTAVVFDQAPFVEDSIHGLATEGGLGLLFAVLVILVFLRSMRSTLVSAISIPLSLAVTFIAMSAGGYTLNILTLGALTISIGRVVDDAIVVIENIKRHMSYGEEKTTAILAAVREVGGAIAASTICTVAVFLPIAFVGGMVGELFRPFALTVSIAMLASLVVALTIVPVLAYWFISPPKKAGRGAALARAAAEEKESRGVWQRIYVPTLNGADAAADIRAAVGGLTEEPATEVSVSAGDAVGTSSIDLVVRARDDATLTEATDQLQEATSGLDGVAEVSNDLAAAQEIVEVTVDREAAAGYGLTETQVTAVAFAAMAGAREIGELHTAEGPVGVTLAAGAVPSTMGEIREVPVPTAVGAIPLGDVANVEVAGTPTSISRIDGDRSATVSVTPAGDDLGAVTDAVNLEIGSIDLPAGATVSVGGAAADQAEAFKNLGMALLAAIALVFIVMVAAFRSLAQPFVLLVSIPFAAVGALVALVATNTPLGVPALIGTLLLVGIVVSNAIVLIDLINQYRQDGMGLDQAVREGARKRLRPIVMTALATVFALLPMAFGLTGGGAFISQPLALVVIGGLVSSTLLTLYVVPVIYTIFERRAERRRAADRAAGRTTRRPLTGAFPSVATGAFQTVGREAAAQRRAQSGPVQQGGPVQPSWPPAQPDQAPPARHSRPTPAQVPAARVPSADLPPQHAGHHAPHHAGRAHRVPAQPFPPQPTSTWPPQVAPARQQQAPQRGVTPHPPQFQPQNQAPQQRPPSPWPPQPGPVAEPVHQRPTPPPAWPHPLDPPD